MLRKLRWSLGFAITMVLTIPFAILPLRFSYFIGERLGIIIFSIMKSWRQLGFENIKSSLSYLQSKKDWCSRTGSPERITRDLFTNIGGMLAELSKLLHGFDKKLIESVEFRGIENYLSAKTKNKGVIFITAHSGNWELMALSFGAKYNSISIVVRQTEKHYATAILERMRSKYGNSVIYRDRSIRKIMDAMRNNVTLGLLIDQASHPANGVKVDFLGRPAWTSKLPAKIALKTGAAIVPIFACREKAQHIVTIHPEVILSTAGTEEENLVNNTILLNGYIEDHITRYPDQWNWLYKRWKWTEQ